MEERGELMWGELGKKTHNQSPAPIQRMSEGAALNLTHQLHLSSSTKQIKFILFRQSMKFAELIDGIK